MAGFLTINNAKELYRLPTDKIVCIKGNGDYSVIMMADAKSYTVTLQLGQLEEMLGNQLPSNNRDMVRIGKSLIINLGYLIYINPAKKQIKLSDCQSFEFNEQASKEALIELKNYLGTL